MRMTMIETVSVLAAMQLVGCAATQMHDLAHYPFPEAQAELHKVLQDIRNDAETANVAGLRDGHLNSEKFTKFGGRRYERMDFKQCTDGETANITAVQEFKYDPKDVKIDVFGEVAVMTYYPHVTAKKDGEVLRYSSRQTLVFLKTPDGWKIVHEHQSQKRYEE